MKKSIVLALIFMLMILEWPAYNIFRYNDITAQAEKAGADTSGAAELLKTWEKCSVEDAQHTIDLTDEEYLKQQTENNSHGSSEAGDEPALEEEDLRGLTVVGAQGPQRLDIGFLVDHQHRQGKAD